MVELYRGSGLEKYEKVHYSHGEHIREVEQILSWYHYPNTRILDIGCSGGLHAIEFARRGFSVTGVDIEPSAILRAERRSRDQMARAEFKVLDIEKDEISFLGTFDFIYSIGNVLSHIRKERIYDVFKKIRGCLEDRGVFLFDLLMKGKPFQEEVRQDDLKIIWKRRLDEQTSMISMDGIFVALGFTQHFDVWGYSQEEVHRIANLSGFSYVQSSDRLDFSPTGIRTENPVFLNFLAKREEGI